MSVVMQIMLSLVVAGVIWYFIWLSNQPIKPLSEQQKEAEREYLRNQKYSPRKYWYEK